MRFHINHNFRTTLRIADVPAFSLATDNWDDFGTKSLFYLRFHNGSGEVCDIGQIKILKKGETRTVLPEEFESLDCEYMALGQGLEFYKNLLECCGPETSIEALEALQDVAWNASLAEPFETSAPFRNSILRENRAHKARRFGRAVILGQEIEDNFSFTYKGQIPGAAEPTEVSISFDDRDLVPGRIVGVIGRNAVGKTQYLSQLANDLVQIRQTSEEKANQRDEKFNGHRPIFNRVITISYSAFDKFSVPSTGLVSYVYCGIRNKNGGLSRKSLLENYKANLQRIRSHGRQRAWIGYMQEILGDQSQVFRDHLNDEISSDGIEDGSLSLSSSGQAILANFITSLVAWLETNSLVLFDEPETHLHPNAVASLFNVFNEILDDYESFAIVATHSPIVIQEIPNKRVILFERDGNITSANQLPVETFGENISELTRHVFETSGIPAYYKKVLSDLARSYPFETVMELFGNGLSMNAQSYLITRYVETN